MAAMPSGRSEQLLSIIVLRVLHYDLEVRVRTSATGSDYSYVEGLAGCDSGRGRVEHPWHQTEGQVCPVHGHGDKTTRGATVTDL